MTRLDHLEAANPISADDEWGTTPEGRALFASIEEAVEMAELAPADNARTKRPWVYAIVGFSVAVAASIPLWLLNGSGQEPLGTPDEIASGSFDDIFADFKVTREEVELAGEKLSSCVTDRGGLGKGAGLSLGPRGEVGYTTNAPEALETCWEELRMQEIVDAWSTSIELIPGEIFYVSFAELACTEARTGKTFGPMTTDHLGYLSDEGHRTLNRASDQEPFVYNDCVGSADDQHRLYSEVLECVESTTGSALEELTDDGTTRLDHAAVAMLQGAREAHPVEFSDCLKAEFQSP